MSVVWFLIPITFCLGLVGLGAFIWNLQSGQYEDLSGAGERVLIDPPGRMRGDMPGEPATETAPSGGYEEKATWSQV